MCMNCTYKGKNKSLHTPMKSLLCIPCHFLYTLSFLDIPCHSLTSLVIPWHLFDITLTYLDTPWCPLTLFEIYIAYWLFPTLSSSLSQAFDFTQPVISTNWTVIYWHTCSKLSPLYTDIQGTGQKWKFSQISSFLKLHNALVDNTKCVLNNA